MANSDLSLEALQSDHIILRDFRASQAHDVWLKYLLAMAEDVNKRLINAITDPLDQLRYIQGVLAGLRMAQTVPDNVETMAKMAQKK